ncbi:MAG: PQQ-binding-like beta-propeller repeat protein [Verrucomicrobiota bacterium]
MPLLLATELGGLAAPWPSWRGPEGTGVSPEKSLPVHWGPDQNIRWRTGLPGPGNSTPIIWGERIFVTQAIENRRMLLCFDRATGRQLWAQGPAYAEPESTHETNPQGSSSPATDGERVVAWFGSAGLYCYDVDGKEQWHRDFGRQNHIWGWGSSPVFSGDLCYLNFGPGEPSFLVAVDKKTGGQVWKVPEATADTGEKKVGQDKPLWVGSWSTPIVITAGQRQELILTGPNRVQAFEPTTGQELWNCAGLNPLVYTSPLYDRTTGIVVAMGGYMGMALAVTAGGAGDVTASRRLWHHPKTKQRIGSGVIDDRYIYILNDPGIAECYQLQTGKLVWEERLRGPAPKSDNWSSMVAGAGKLYVINQGGDAFVLRASPRFEVLATNSMGETTISSPAVSDGEIFLRTHKALWCVSERVKAAAGKER